MDRFFVPHSPEAKAHSHFTENAANWDLDTGVDETLVAQLATYSAFARYLSGADLYIPPRSRPELESVLRRYSADAIHNIISLSPRSRGHLQPGGYSRMCHTAELSIKNVLDINDNGAHLLELHNPAAVISRDRSPARSVKIQ